MLTLIGTKKNGSIFKLSDLIFELENIKELKRIRYTTSHPKDMTSDLIKCHKISKKLSPFIHLPIQSGSNTILKSMNRKHTREDYLNIIKNLVAVRPEIKFSSDFIVGYPGETEKDFEDTLSLINNVKFINSFSFIYNQRPGTPAFKLNPLKKEIQHNRLIILQNLLNNIQKNFNKNQIGKNKKVLIENKMKNQEKYFGRTDSFTPVVTENIDDKDIGKIINVRIKDCNKNTLFGVKENIDKEVAA